jgi:hypothetical protein
MSLQKQNTQKLTVKAARGASNGRHESIIRGKVIIIIISVIVISTLVTYLVSSSFM